MENYVSNHEKLKFTKKITLFSTVTIMLLILIALMGEVINQDHEFLSPLSLLFFFFTSIICITLALLPSVTAQFTALYYCVFFLHRVILVYFIPDWLDYKEYFLNSKDFIEGASIFFFFCMLALMFGFLIPLLSKSRNNSDKNLHINNLTYISFFKVKTSLFYLINYAILITLTLLIFQFYINIYLSIGRTGSLLIDNDFNIEIALILLIKSAIPVGIFGLVVSLNIQNKKNRNCSLILLLICLISALISTSRGVMLTFILYFYYAVCILEIKNQKKYIITLITIGAISIIFFPFITYLRAFLNEADYTLLEQIKAFTPIREISGRVGYGFEGYLLWYKYLELGSNESLPSIYSEIIRLINGFVPGEIFKEQELVNIAKLQVLIGRPEIPYYNTVEYLNQSGGGHGESIGAYGLAFLLFGFIAPLFFFTTGYLACLLEYSKINIFWIFYINLFLIATPSLLPTPTTLRETLFIICLILVAFLLKKIKSNVRVHSY